MEARLDGELNAARAIQLGLLPRHFPGPPDRRDLEVFASIEPARMVGGDLYDFVLLDPEHLSFAIADVSGKGVPAALFMAMTKEVLHTATLRYRNALDRVFNEANDKISAASEELGAGGTNMMFVTVFAGILDLASGMLVYVNAGHDSPFVIRAGAEPEKSSARGRAAARHGRRLSVFDRATSACARRDGACLHRRSDRGAGHDTRRCTPARG